MFVYRLASPIDFFDEYEPLPDWLRDASPEKTAWLLEATLALADAAPVVRWGGDMQHLPFVDSSDEEPALVVKQDNNGDTFVVGRKPVTWAEDLHDRQHETRPRDIGAFVFTLDDFEAPDPPEPCASIAPNPWAPQPF